MYTEHALLFRWILMILHLLRMRRNVNRNVFNDRRNVSATTYYIHIKYYYTTLVEGCHDPPTHREMRLYWELRQPNGIQIREW